MTEAVAALISAPQAGQALPAMNEGPGLEMFASWCQCIRWQAPENWPDDARDEAYCLSGDLADWFYSAIGRAAERSRVAGPASADAYALDLAALLWVTFWHQGGMTDPANPCLPNAEKTPWQRDMVDMLAEQHPDLAKAAGLA